jgi:putative transposase
MLQHLKAGLLNSKLRDEFLNGEIFYSIRDLRVLAEHWRIFHCNTVRSHSSLDCKPPAPAAWPISTARPEGTALVALLPPLPAKSCILQNYSSRQ